MVDNSCTVLEIIHEKIGFKGEHKHYFSSFEGWESRTFYIDLRRYVEGLCD